MAPIGGDGVASTGGPPRYFLPLKPTRHPRLPAQTKIMRSIELFSGAGGMALGLAAAGFDSGARFERDVDACATLRKNRPQWKVVQGVVRDVDFTRYGPVE